MQNDKHDKLTRFSITIPEELLSEFEENYYSDHKRENRSEAIRFLMRQYISGERWKSDDNKEVCATVTIIYDHHLPGLSCKLTAAQHDSGGVIICSTHVHLSHSSCLECIITKGLARDIKKFIDALKSIRGIKNLDINITAEV
ncbi:MAG: nickel-responsive transcriptional regulator NikR [Synergistaceae bacterium]|nr:nickel-responsive transcriptional regulator NikR [Synergistaceae bacterium]